MIAQMMICLALIGADRQPYELDDGDVIMGVCDGRGMLVADKARAPDRDGFPVYQVSVSARMHVPTVNGKATKVNGGKVIVTAFGPGKKKYTTETECRVAAYMAEHEFATLKTFQPVPIPKAPFPVSKVHVVFIVEYEVDGEKHTNEGGYTSWPVRFEENGPVH